MGNLLRGFGSGLGLGSELEFRVKVLPDIAGYSWSEQNSHLNMIYMRINREGCSLIKVWSKTLLFNTKFVGSLLLLFLFLFFCFSFFFFFFFATSLLFLFIVIHCISTTERNAIVFPHHFHKNFLDQYITASMILFLGLSLVHDF